MRQLLIGASRDHVIAGLKQPMFGRMRPVHRRGSLRALGEDASLFGVRGPGRALTGRHVSQWKSGDMSPHSKLFQAPFAVAEVLQKIGVAEDLELLAGFNAETQRRRDAMAPSY